MVVTADGIYDEGGKWIFGGDGRSFIQLLPDANVDAVRFVAENTSGYAWDNRSLGIKPDLQQMTYPLEFMGCIACAAGLPYSLNTLDMRTSSQMEADQLAFTFGVSSLAALPVTTAVAGLAPVASGFALGAGFDGVGQWVNGGEYRPWQTVVSGVTGGLAYPLAGGLWVNTLLSGAVGGTNTAANNYMYAEDKSIRDAIVVGAISGGVGSYLGQWGGGAAAHVLPHRIGAGVIDPNKAILLQNIGARNPYPGYIGGVLENSVGAGIPIVIEAMQKDRE